MQLIDSNEARQIAETTRNQIGARTLFCVGAHNFSFSNELGKVSLDFKTRGCGRRGRYVRVTYNFGSDLYTVEGINFTMKAKTVKYQLEGVYSDMLREIVIKAAEA